ncbi:7-cyano-7-deazaguanine synthase QueC [Desulfomonile tiedjei]|uniref:7-cyano-7-deazaguanine synthase n=1 Tax=Desulfomonile tiedjei (strain ATCC 49306 / DSM 6799 / DCB-1) TaxID=706587 RepID=I4C7D7_DESTA|nr:7-cyano-7-deazaguanine synthase QueC [Desulfomonile tiedjei]AFM25478.1 preQ(0) biosynthesis protein QueC [Desulfomonile tiedjei DSM 6799]
MQKRPEEKAVVLLSGGLDSTTCLAIARAQGYLTYALSFFYDQRHEIEMRAAKRVAAIMGITHHLILQIPLGKIGGSALTSDLQVPKSADISHMPQGIPLTYVPARNTIFLSFALAWAEVLEAENIFIGVNALDYSGYPDCRPEYIAAFETMANLGTKMAVEGFMRFRIHTPLIRLSKGEIIKKGIELGVDYSATHSCYDPDPEGMACGHCDSCLLRKKGFAEAGVPDPTVYVE